MPAGIGEAEAPIAPEAAFRHLADPRNVAEWFAAVALDTPPQDPLRVGLTWRFTPTRGGGGPMRLRLATYEPPTRFVWATTRYWPRTNLSWDVSCLSLADMPSHTWIRVTIRIAPGPLGWLALWLTFGRSQQALVRRAQAAADRAAETLTDIADVTQQRRDRTRDERRQGTKRGGRRR